MINTHMVVRCKSLTTQMHQGFVGSVNSALYDKNFTSTTQVSQQVRFYSSTHYFISTLIRHKELYLSFETLDKRGDHLNIAPHMTSLTC